MRLGSPAGRPVGLPAVRAIPSTYGQCRVSILVELIVGV
jgi:hypothetical protein